MRKLTIGMAVYDDYDGAYFTIQAIRMFHSEVLDDIEFIIINNNPTSASGKALHGLMNWIKEPVQYLEFNGYSSTSIRDKIFALANTDYVLSVDCHVMINPNGIADLIEYYDKGLDNGNLIQGPLVYDDLQSKSTHFNLKWSNKMWGTWGTDERIHESDCEPFEIPAQGLGLFSCRKDSWLGFNSKFRGFGGEEGYIHTKYKMIGKKTICLPSLCWLHRFERPLGVPYSLDIKERFRNYMIGFQEIGRDVQEVINIFKDSVSSSYIDEVKLELIDIANQLEVS
jgi:hypothetical protein